MLQHRSYPALQATERGSSRGNLSPLTVFWFLLYAQKERLRGERCLLCLCKRLHAAEGDYKAAAKNLEGYNAAIALVQSNDLAGAKKAIAKDNSADADYLRAVIAAKEGDLKTAEAQLKSAVSKNPALAQKAAKDINLKPLQK